MVEKKIKIIAKDGIHMRPAGLIVDEASKYISDIHIHKEGEIADAKSMMEISMLAIFNNDEITIVANGEDEEEAIESLEKLMIGNFNDCLDVKR